jgi:hypothetical protein
LGALVTLAIFSFELPAAHDSFAWIAGYRSVLGIHLTQVRPTGCGWAYFL